MAEFNELLEMLRNPGEDGLPDDFADQLSGAYENSTSTAAAKVAELEGANSEHMATIASLKSHNYDLMRSMPSSEGDPIPSGEGDSADFDDLFE